MSRAAKLTLAGTSLGTIGIVALVHYQQKSEKVVRYSFIPYILSAIRRLSLRVY